MQATITLCFCIVINREHNLQKTTRTPLSITQSNSINTWTNSTALALMIFSIPCNTCITVFTIRLASTEIDSCFCVAVIHVHSERHSSPTDSPTESHCFDTVLPLCLLRWDKWHSACLLCLYSFSRQVNQQLNVFPAWFSPMNFPSNLQLCQMLSCYISSTTYPNLANHFFFPLVLMLWHTDTSVAVHTHFCAFSCALLKARSLVFWLLHTDKLKDCVLWI